MLKRAKVVGSSRPVLAPRGFKIKKIIPVEAAITSGEFSLTCQWITLLKCVVPARYAVHPACNFGRITVSETGVATTSVLYNSAVLEFST